IGPDIDATLAERPDVIPRQLARRKAHAAIHAQIRIATEESLVVQRRYIVVPGIAGIPGVPDRRDDGVDFKDGPTSTRGIDAAVQSVERRSAGISHLLLVIQSRGFLVVDPLEGHAGDISTEDELGERPRGGPRDDPQVILMAVVGAV